MNPQRKISLRASSKSVVLSILLTLVTFLPPFPISQASATFLDSTCDLAALSASGDGSASTPWEIANPDQLWEITDCQGDHFKLTSDIDAANASAGTPTSSPIGTGATPNYDSLTGTLDGQGHSISFSMSVIGPAALFKKILGAEIKNLTLVGSVSTSPSSGTYTGGLASWADGTNTISNVTVTSHITALSQTGGFIGQVMDGLTLFTDCQFAGNLEIIGGMPGGSAFVGGFVGSGKGAITIRDSISSGEISASSAVQSVGGFIGQHEIDPLILSTLTRSAQVSGGRYVGGIVGVASAVNSATLSGNVNQGEVLSSVGDAGGLVGLLTGRAFIENSYNAGGVSAPYPTGGFIGSLGSTTYQLTIRSSINSGSITSSAGTQAAGFIGGFDNSNTNLTLSELTNSGAIWASNGNAGGIFGYGGALSMTLHGLTNTGDVSGGSTQVGGIIGNLKPDNAVSLSGLVNTGRVTGTSKIGGVIGNVVMVTSNTSITFSDLVNSGTVSGTTYLSSGGNIYGTGGVIGHLYQVASPTTLVMYRTANRGNVSSKNQAAGIIGAASISNLVIRESVNTGDLDADTNYSGGILGYASNNVVISDAYSQGSYVGGRTGGIVGYGASSITYSNVYSVATLSGNSTLDALDAGTFVPATTSVYVSSISRYTDLSSRDDLLVASTFTGWDFSNVWAFATCGTNASLPALRWENTATYIYTESCYVVVTPAANSPVASAEKPTPQPYSGPLITEGLKVVRPGSTIELVGLKLDQVTSVWVDGTEIDVVLATTQSITLNFPETLKSGFKDIVIYSSYGRLTVMRALEVQEAPESSQLLGYRMTPLFAGNSRILEESQESFILQNLKEYDSASTVICWGYTTASDPAEWAIEHATARAQSVCSLVAEANPTLRVEVRVRFGVPKVLAMRASLQYWSTGPAA